MTSQGYVMKQNTDQQTLVDIIITAAVLLVFRREQFGDMHGVTDPTTQIINLRLVTVC